MIETLDFAKHAEEDLRTSRKLGPWIGDAWAGLSPIRKAALAPALAFLGCQDQSLNGAVANTTEQPDRVAACRLMLLPFFLVQEGPAWSSYVLDRFLEAVMRIPGGSVEDLFIALYDLLSQQDGSPSHPLANFIKVVVILCFQRYRGSYDGVDWSLFTRQAEAEANPAQLYLLMHGLPPQLVSAELARRMRNTFADSPYQAEAAALTE